MRGGRLLAVALVLAAPSIARADGAPEVAQGLPRAGLLAAGINIDLLEIGAAQAYGSGGSSSGAMLGLGAELDLGPRAALRLPLRVTATGDTPGADGQSAPGLIALVFAPAFIYRLRNQADQRWVPYFGGALDLGFFQFGRPLLGLDPSPKGTDQAFVRLGVAPEILAGVLWSPARWFSIRLAAGYSYFYVAHVSAHSLYETVGIRLSL
jgi:hypothetical protein